MILITQNSIIIKRVVSHLSTMSYILPCSYSTWYAFAFMELSHLRVMVFYVVFITVISLGTEMKLSTGLSFGFSEVI